jgi:hypothetical protein
VKEDKKPVPAATAVQVKKEEKKTLGKKAVPAKPEAKPKVAPKKPAPAPKKPVASKKPATVAKRVEEKKT